MKSKRLNEAVDLVTCTQCGYLLRRVFFDSFARGDNGRRCADYWDVLEIKRPIYDCPTCGAALSTQTVKPVSATCERAARKQTETAKPRLRGAFAEILHNELLPGVGDAEHHQAMALLQEHQTAGQLTIEAVWDLENAIGLLAVETAEQAFMAGLAYGHDPRRLVCQ